MSSSSTRLAIGDFVSVERNDKPNQPLKGVIAFMGPVSFAEGSDWVGVRLTGDSVGEGRNDGSVKGKRYFEDCGENGGAFVRKSSISKRQPTRLEELRLRRERKAKGTPAGSSSTSSTRKSLGGLSKTSLSTPSKSSSPSKPKSQLQTPSSKSSSEKIESTAKPVESEGVSRVKKQMEQLRKNRASVGGNGSSTSTVTAEKDKEIKNLKEQNDALTEQTEDLESQKEALQQELHDLRMQLASPTKATRQTDDDTTDAFTGEPQTEGEDSKSTSEVDKETIIALQTESDQLKTQLQTTTTQLTETRSKIASMEQKSQNQQNEITSLINDLNQTKTQLSTAEHELHTISSQNSTHQSSAQSQLKERAKLQAEVASLKRTLKEMEEEKVNVESMMEELTLDLEQVKEEKETLEDTLQEKNLETETQMIDMEDLKIQLEEVGVQLDQARAQLEEHELQGTIKSSGGRDDGADSESTPTESKAQSADTDDVVRALSVQNARLREALLRLREQSTYEKMELSKQLRTAEKESSQLSTLQGNHEKLQTDSAQKEKDIRELKEMVDEAHAYEGLMEEMSDKNILLEDANVALQATIQSLEEASEIAAEMEEVQAEENKTLMADLEDRDAKLRNLQEAIKM